MGTAGPTKPRTGITAAVAAVLFGFLLASARGAITRRVVSRDTRRLIFLEKPFGFGSDGRVDVEIRNFEARGPVRVPILGDVYVCIVPADEASILGRLEMGCEQGGGDPSCGWEQEQVRCIPLFNFSSPEVLSEVERRGGAVFSANEESVDPGQGTLLYVNWGPDLLMVSFDISMSMYNRDSSGGRHYLGVGEAKLPVAYLVISVMFLLLARWWSLMCQNKKCNIHRIHRLMLGVAILKALTSATRAGMMHNVNCTGLASIWATAFHFCSSTHSIALVAVLMLLRAGWTHSTACLSLQHKEILLVACLMQGVASVAAIVVEENSPIRMTWMNWGGLYWIMDIGSFLTLLRALPPFMPDDAFSGFMKPVNAIREPINAILRRPMIYRLIWALSFCWLSIAILYFRSAMAVMVVVDPTLLFAVLVPFAAGLPIVGSLSGAVWLYLRLATVHEDASCRSRVVRWTVFSFAIAAHFYFTRALVCFLHYVSVEHYWLYSTMGDVVSIIFYMAVGYLFRPMSSDSFQKLPLAAA
ncbi:unnamed protein product [Ostreobium quekettii]|uniref:GOST seven transmembrane domain-containing protein n=1 Tax=Ostreobium quekettii TaxID=121088 RepID=A0A8S1ISN7_9CHLO|nr:unnamed protein product [Ostreobium quekettii]|eukprot:evm.model.scf_278.2 EVM.evm.TU.scf_278.2   scf_278:57767-60197(-)